MFIKVKKSSLRIYKKTIIVDWRDKKKIGINRLIRVKDNNKIKKKIV